MCLVWCQRNKEEEFGQIKFLFFQEPENDPKKVGWVWQCAQKDEYLQAWFLADKLFYWSWLSSLTSESHHKYFGKYIQA